ncbi:ABC transporter permease [Acidobacteriota bacterium]
MIKPEEKNGKPPRLAERLLLKVLLKDEREEKQGDLFEAFLHYTKKKGFRRARVWYWKQILLAFPAFIFNLIYWSVQMFRHYLMMTLRNIKRYKGYSLINVAGLAIGMTCCLLIFLLVKEELSYDKFHTKSNRIYRIAFSSSDDEPGLPTNANGSFGVGPNLKKDYPEIIETVRLRRMGQDVKRYVGYKEKKFYEEKFFFAEPSIFTVFDFPLLRGNPETALNEPNSMVLSEEMAEKYFVNEDPIGKIIEADPYNDGDIMLFFITGVAKNIPRNSHFHFDFLASYSSQRDDLLDFSSYMQNYTYALLSENSTADSMNAKLFEFLQRHWREDPWYTISLQPLRDIRLHSRLRSEIEPTGNILYIYIFSAIALFILIIACINFMNLSTARSVNRAKEVGVRKVLGAQKKQLVRQFLGESIFLSVCSMLASIFAVLLILPLFNRLTEKNLMVSAFLDPTFIAAALSITLVVGLSAGLYPALFLSAFQPLHSLKSKFGNIFSCIQLRKGLVIFQFVLSIGIIFATLTTQKQMKYIQSRNIGYDKNQIMVMPLNRELRTNYDSFRNELLTNPAIENTTTSSYVPTKGSGHLSLKIEGKEELLNQVIYMVDKEFVNTYGLNLLEGNNIHAPISEDGTSEFLVSELSTKEAGFSSSLEAVGKGANLHEYTGQITGVVNDMNIYSLHQEPYSISYMITPIRSHNYLSIRVLPQNIPETIGFIEKIWKRTVPHYPLEYFFLDTSFEKMHHADEKLSEIFSTFSILAICVSCLGLFGLASFTAEQKTKEIGIRKVLGASAFSIYLQLSRDFLKWVIAANIIAWPTAFFFMQKWLQGFAFRTKIGWEIFLLSASLALIISIFTVSFQTLKAARANPVDSLRYE